MSGGNFLGSNTLDAYNAIESLDGSPQKQNNLNNKRVSHCRIEIGRDIKNDGYLGTSEGKY